MFEPELTKMQPTKQRGEKGKKKKRRRSGRFVARLAFFKKI